MPRCPGRPTAAAGTPSTAWPTTASRAAGKASALAKVVDAIEARPGFLPANWNDRSVVEITGENRTGVWFLHALTGDEWLLTLKFRVPKRTFDEEELRQQLDLKSLDDLDELPIYGRSERVRIRNIKGPWQEVTITVHWLREIETRRVCAISRPRLRRLSGGGQPRKTQSGRSDAVEGAGPQMALVAQRLSER